MFSLLSFLKGKVSLWDCHVCMCVSMFPCFPTFKSISQFLWTLEWTLEATTFKFPTSVITWQTCETILGLDSNKPKLIHERIKSRVKSNGNVLFPSIITAHKTTVQPICFLDYLDAQCYWTTKRRMTDWNALFIIISNNEYPDMLLPYGENQNASKVQCIFQQ